MLINGNTFFVSRRFENTPINIKSKFRLTTLRWNETSKQRYLRKKYVIKYSELKTNESLQGSFVNYVSIQGYLVGQQNAYFTKQTLFSKHAYLGYLLGQKQAKICLRNLRTAHYLSNYYLSTFVDMRDLLLIVMINTCTSFKMVRIQS